MEVPATRHRIYSTDARDMKEIADSSVDLVVTSPPYPMIEMWDSIFSDLNPSITSCLAEEKPDRAYDLMHQELDKAWVETWRVLKNGGIACINIGDATRTIGGEYRLYPSHSSISMSMRKIGFYESPSIIWKKQTNSPNKFLGSGTMPCPAPGASGHMLCLAFLPPGMTLWKGSCLRRYEGCKAGDAGTKFKGQKRRFSFRTAIQAH